MKKFSQFSRRTYRVLIYSIAAISIIAAVSISLMRILLSTVDAYHDDIEDLASAYLDYRVEIGVIDARVVGFTPSLIFEKVRLLDSTGSKVVINFNSVRIGISPFQSWRSGQLIPAEVSIDGVELLVVRNKDNSIHIQDVDVTAFSQSGTRFQSQNLDENDLTKLFFSRTNLVLSNSTVIWKDLKANTEVRRYEDVTLQLQNDGNHHKFHGSLTLPEQFGKKVDIAMNVYGNIRLPTSWKGKMYINANGLNINELGLSWIDDEIKLNHGVLDIEAWSEIDKGRLKNVSGNVALYDVNIEAPYFEEQYVLEYMGGLFDVKLSGDDWWLSVDKFKVINKDHVWPTSKFSASYVTERTGDPAELKFTSEYFRLEDISALMANTKILPQDVYEKLFKTNPSGDITQFSLTTVLDKTATRMYTFQAHYKNLVLNAHGEQPGVAGINGNVWGDETHGRLHVNSNYATVSLPALFRIPIQLEHLDSTFYWQKQVSSLNIWSREIQANSPDIRTASTLLLEIPTTGSAYVDFQTRFFDGDVSNVSDYVPFAIMDEELIDWIDNSIKAGKVIEGGGVFRGRFDDFPYTQQAGAFVVDFTAEKAEVNYMAGWPKIEQVEFQAHFDSSSVEVAVSEARILSTDVNASTIVINDFYNPLLMINGNTTGDLSDISRFLVESPISPESRKFAEDNSFTGSSRTNIYVQIPLSDAMEKVATVGYKGSLDIQDGQIKMIENRIKLNELNGKIEFSDAGEFDKNISAKLFGEPVDIRLFSQKRGGGTVRTLVAQIPVEAKSLFSMAGFKKNNHIKGHSDWQAVFTTSYVENGKVIPTKLKLSSNLEGTEIKLLPPLIKSENKAGKIDVTFLFKEEATEVNLALEGIIDSQFAFRNNKLLPRIGVHFGSGKSFLPDDNEMAFSGSLKDFNLNEWFAMIDDFAAKKSSNVFNKIPIKLDMQNLSLKKLSKAEKDDSKLTPKDIHYIKGSINNLVYDDSPFGRVEIELVPGKRRLQIKQLDITSLDYQLKLTGEWKERLLGHSTNVVFDLKSPDTAKMLKQLGFAPIMKGGELSLQGQLGWPTRPKNFTLENIYGNLHLNIKNGALLKVEAGAGRLLGLFSLNELPRRLSLDFQDTFDEGFSFDEIDGDLAIKDGNATTDNLVAKSPVADLKVVGRTGYTAEDFDQRITVIPAVSDTLPIAGGLLFGLEVGLAILIIDAIVGHEINKANLREYHLTGTWDNPVITDLTPVEESESDIEDEI